MSWLALITGIIALSASVVGGITSFVAKRRESMANEAAADANAARVKVETEQKVGDVLEEGAVLKGRQQAMIGASGVSLKTGSPLAMLRDTERKIERDVSRIKEGGEFEAGQYAAQAEAYRKTRPWILASSLMNTAYRTSTAAFNFFG